MQPVSYSPWLILSSFHIYLYHSTSSCARRVCCSSPRALLTSFLLNSLSLPPSPPPIVYRTTMLCLTRPRTRTCTHTYNPYRLVPYLVSNILCRLALVACATEMGDRPTSNTLVEDRLRRTRVRASQRSHAH